MFRFASGNLGGLLEFQAAFFAVVSKQPWLLLDSRVVDVPMSYNPIVVTLSSLKPFFFNGLQSGGALLGPWWSLSPWNPIRASLESKVSYSAKNTSCTTSSAAA